MRGLRAKSNGRVWVETSDTAQRLSTCGSGRKRCALDVEHALHALGVGKGGRIQKDQVERLGRRAAQPFAAVGALQTVQVGMQAVESQVLARPVEIPIGQIEAETARRA